MNDLSPSFCPSIISYYNQMQGLKEKPLHAYEINKNFKRHQSRSSGAKYESEQINSYSFYR
jgi:hypothetical protein